MRTFGTEYTNKLLIEMQLTNKPYFISMKKIFTLMALACMAFTAQAQGKFALEASTEKIVAGTQITSVPNITLTFGFAGEADYKDPAADTSVEGYTAYTAGNGVNGKADGGSGTTYILEPAKNGEITVAVVVNANKAFYVLENGTALSAYNGITVAVVHYNTPKLTRAAILSLWKHTPGCRVVVFDNSDRLPVGGCSEWDELRKSPLVTVVDNTEGQLISFGELLEQYPGRQAFDRNMSNFGSAKHTASVDRLFDMLPDGFVLMDSDVLIRQDISPIVDRGAAASGMLRPNDGVMRLLPLLCWLNVPVLRSHGIRYFNGEKMWALSDVYPNNRYDTGAWLLEEVRRCGLRLDEVDVKDYLIHLGHASWKGRRPMTWVSEHRDLWE